MQALWAEPHVTFKGKWHQIDDAGINPLPLGRRVPIWFGGHARRDAAAHREIRRRLDHAGLSARRRRRCPSSPSCAATSRQAGRDPASVGLEVWVSTGDGTAAGLARRVQVLEGRRRHPRHAQRHLRALLPPPPGQAVARRPPRCHAALSRRRRGRAVGGARARPDRQGGHHRRRRLGGTGLGQRAGDRGAVRAPGCCRVPGRSRRGGGERDRAHHRGRGRHLCHALLRRAGRGKRAGDGAGLRRSFPPHRHPGEQCRRLGAGRRGVDAGGDLGPAKWIST